MHIKLNPSKNKNKSKTKNTTNTNNNNDSMEMDTSEKARPDFSKMTIGEIYSEYMKGDLVDLQVNKLS